MTSMTSSEEEVQTGAEVNQASYTLATGKLSAASNSNPHTPSRQVGEGGVGR